MYRFPESSGFRRSKTWGRLREPTMLREWMRIKKKTVRDVAKGVGASVRSVKYWMNGQALPSLLAAFKLEAYTSGKVTIESWLSTAIAKAKWNEITVEGKQHDQ